MAHPKSRQVEGKIQGVKGISCTPDTSGKYLGSHDCTFHIQGEENMKRGISEVLIDQDVDVKFTGLELESDDYYWNFDEPIECSWSDFSGGPGFKCGNNL